MGTNATVRLTIKCAARTQLNALIPVRADTSGLDGEGSMREAELKARTLAELRSRKLLRHGDIVVSEYVVAGSARRADLAVMSRDFIGVEIKSEFDTLKRLRGQLTSYAGTFDRVILVVAPKHAEAALRDAATGTEIWQFDKSGRCVVLREGYPSEPRIQERLALLTITALRRLTSGDLNASRRALLHAASTVPRPVLDEELRSFFAERYGETSSHFWAQCKGRKIRAEHIQLLSLYSPTRRAHTVARSEEKAFWQNWAQVAATQMTLASI